MRPDSATGSFAGLHWQTLLLLALLAQLAAPWMLAQSETAEAQERGGGRLREDGNGDVVNERVLEPSRLHEEFAAVASSFYLHAVADPCNIP